jgi:prepilin-type N-terminal cleavage/methylation domain-containing protein
MRNNAFTLIELIMTMVVLGIVAVPLSMVVAQNYASVFQSEGMTIAFSLARCDMEVVNNTAYNTLASASVANYQGYSYDLTRTVSYVYGSVISAESLKKITLQVRRAGGAMVLASLVTYRAKNISYGL